MPARRRLRSGRRAFAGRPSGDECKQHRAVATRYDKLASRYRDTITNAAINGRLIPTFSNRP
ncbi:MAG: hypothetical protein DMD46_17285 [Gemmatimonadetes bacterium]|nr:MAG: hypothetical protein DMD46_17285 [Gemmatimonadota bacterium]